MLIDKKFLYLILINFLINLYSLVSYQYTFNKMLFILLVVVLFISLTYIILDSIFSNKISGAIKSILVGVSFILAIIDLFLINNFGTSFNSAIFSPILATTQNELAEFIQMYILDMKNILIAAGFIVINMSLFALMKKVNLKLANLSIYIYI